MAARNKTAVQVENDIISSYGENVFDLKSMKDFLPPKVYATLRETILEDKPLPRGIEDDVAKGMKEWALSKGATHYTHWFLPLTGLTAEKHDSFVEPLQDGKIELKFKGKHLRQGEPDASSFPSGGLRATFEARGYTAWDPTSPAFIKYSEDAPTLCIPTAFASYTGEALDKKTPLLRSIEALSKSIRRFVKIIDGKVPNKKGIVTLGAEQEYFLIDKQFFLARPDLIQCGRTLFGAEPAKHQQKEDHYFGSIRKRIVTFMQEVDEECWKLGIPAKTRHNEVAPAQFELAAVYEELNLAVDHNMMIMQILKEVAEKHGFVCLMHEKPFAGINGSGKHNNWSIAAPDGSNLMNPGTNPHDNAKFLACLCAVIQAVDDYAALLRSVVASAGNDHRLGANEAPPAIISIFLGEQLQEIIDQIEAGGAKSSRASDVMKLGVSSLPDLPKDVTDRNRTSPFAFTGSKFEFRAVGSAQSCAGPNVVLNTITAQALDNISDQLEGVPKAKIHDELQKILQKIIKAHKRILFNGDNYSKAWEIEAAKRGLPNIKKTDDALKEIKSKKSMELFGKYKVLSEGELVSRYNIYLEEYEKTISIEGKCALDLARTMFMPAAREHATNIADSITAISDVVGKDASVEGMKKNLKKVTSLIGESQKAAQDLENALIKHQTRDTLSAMEKLRVSIDSLEMEVEDILWPVPKYRDMLFLY